MPDHARRRRGPADDSPGKSDTWYVVVEEPGHALTQVGPVSIALDEQKTLDITCTPGGQIRGQVTGIPQAWDRRVRVVVFSKTGVRAEARAAPGGHFTLPSLPPGEYGLKADHDAYDDAEVYLSELLREHFESLNEHPRPPETLQGSDGQARPRYSYRRSRNPPMIKSVAEVMRLDGTHLSQCS
jgi:hypothetical protein